MSTLLEVGSSKAPPPPLHCSQVVEEGAEPPLQHLLHRLQQRVVDDVKSFIQRMAGQLLQSGQLVHLLDHIIITISRIIISSITALISRTTTNDVYKTPNYIFILTDLVSLQPVKHFTCGISLMSLKSTFSNSNLEVIKPSQTKSNQIKSVVHCWGQQVPPDRCARHSELVLELNLLGVYSWGYELGLPGEV